MAASKRSHNHNIDPTICPTYDMGFEESDKESSGSGVSLDESVPKDYWFGQKYFQCVIAQYSLQRSELDEEVAVVESRFEAVLQRFPYAEAVKQLTLCFSESHIPAATNDPSEMYRMVMTWIGAILRAGDSDRRTTLIALLRRCAASTESELYRRPMAVDRQLVASKSTKDSTSISREMHASSPTIGDFAMALKEYGDKHGFVPVYTVNQLSNMPSRFQADLVVDGRKFVGVASNKKRARHQAASRACLFLEIGA